MQCEADRSHHREHQSGSSDDEPGRHESSVVLPEADAEKRRDEASCQRSRADRETEYARLEPLHHDCTQLLTIGGRSSLGRVSIGGPPTATTVLHACRRATASQIPRPMGVSPRGRRTASSPAVSATQEQQDQGNRSEQEDPGTFLLHGDLFGVEQVDPALGLNELGTHFLFLDRAAWPHRRSRGGVELTRCLEPQLCI